MADSDHFWDLLYRLTTAPGVGFRQQLESLLEVGCKRFDMQSAVVTDVEGEQFTVLASIGPDKAVLAPGRVFDLKVSACSRVIGQPSAFRIDSMVDDMSPYENMPVRIEQYIGQAVRIDGQAFGTVCFFSGRHNGKPVSDVPDDEMGILMLIAAALIERKMHLESEQRVRQIASVVENSEDAIYTETLDREVLSWNRSAEQLFGYSAQEMIGVSADVLYPSGAASLPDDLFEKVRRGERTSSIEAMQLRKDGTEVHTSLNFSPIRDTNGEVTASSVVARDIDERKRAEAALARSEQRYALAAKGSNDGLWDWDLNSNEVYYSPRWKSILGYPEQQELSGPDAWTDLIHSADMSQFHADLAFHLAGQTDQFYNEHRVTTRGGEERWVLCRGVAVRDKNGQAVRIAGSLTDITKQKKSETALIEQAQHDKLTGLPNRTYFTEIVRTALARSRRNTDYKFAVLFLDFDRFKIINDSLGHEYGDMLLVNIAQQLRVQLRTVDVAARLGGDEFVVLLDGIDGLGGAIDVAERLLTTFSTPHNLKGHEVISTASIGIVTSEGEYRKPEELIRDADTAMYQAKAQGKARFVVFDEQMHAKAMQRLNLEKDMRRAVALGQMRLVYQPIVSLECGALCGFEALLRWEHPEHGPISPDEFITIAEETGEIVAIGSWVLKRACRQLVKWKQMYPGAADLYMNINVSKRQIAQPDVVKQLSQVFEQTKVSPGDIKLEITESVIMDDRHGITPVLDEIRALGVKLAMDDFGTGHSSLSCLHRFPIDVLKIDREFIKNMEQRIEYTAVVQAIVTLAHTLGISVVAEGLETADQVAQLQALECDTGQGYFFAKPLSTQEAGDFIVTLNEQKLSA